MAAVLPQAIDPYNCAKLLISGAYRLFIQNSTTLFDVCSCSGGSPTD